MNTNNSQPLLATKNPKSTGLNPYTWRKRHLSVFGQERLRENFGQRAACWACLHRLTPQVLAILLYFRPTGGHNPYIRSAPMQTPIEDTQTSNKDAQATLASQTSTNTRALIFSYSDSLFYFVGITQEPLGQSDSVTFFKDDCGNLMKYRSLFHAKQYLASLGFSRGWLVMQSAYDEMIGNEPAQKAEMPWVIEAAVA